MIENERLRRIARNETASAGGLSLQVKVTLHGVGKRKSIDQLNYLEAIDCALASRTASRKACVETGAGISPCRRARVETSLP